MLALVLALVPAQGSNSAACHQDDQEGHRRRIVGAVVGTVGAVGAAVAGVATLAETGPTGILGMSARRERE